MSVVSFGVAIECKWVSSIEVGVCDLWVSAICGCLRFVGVFDLAPIRYGEC